MTTTNKQRRAQHMQWEPPGLRLPEIESDPYLKPSDSFSFSTSPPTPTLREITPRD